MNARAVRPRVTRLGAAIAVTAAMLASASQAGAQTANTLEGIPRLSTVITIVLENESYNATWGPGSPATYLNSLRSQGVLLSQYYGAGHVSADNYISLTSGQAPNPDTSSDCVNWLSCKEAVSSPAFGNGVSIADQLEAAGLTWKAYVEDMAFPCLHSNPTDATDPYQGNTPRAPSYNYADRHNPFIYYAPIVDDTARCRSHVVNYSNLSQDLAGGAATMPNYAFIVPNTCHDGHDTPVCSDGTPGGLVAADAWLQSNVPPLISYVMSHNGLLVITFDEGANSDTGGCCGAGPGGAPGFGGRIGLLAISPHVTPGTVLVTPYDHPSLLRTIEDAFGIATHLNNAGANSERAMSDLFTQ